MMSLLEAAKQAINEVFGDSTVAPEQTLEWLEELFDEINMLIAAVELDIERAAEE